MNTKIQENNSLQQTEKQASTEDKVNVVEASTQIAEEYPQAKEAADLHEASIETVVAMEPQSIANSADVTLIELDVEPSDPSLASDPEEEPVQEEEPDSLDAI